MNTDSIKDLLYGPVPFYNQPTYRQTTTQDFAAEKPLPKVIYEWNTESRVMRIAKQILCIIVLPIAICQILHRLIGKVFIHASSPFILEKLHDFKETPLSCKRSVKIDGVWQFLRRTVLVNGTEIDTMLVGRKDTWQNRRWTIVSGGNGEFFETMLTKRHRLFNLLRRLNSNAILFNYPGVGASCGLPNKQGMIHAYKAILSLVEDKNHIGATEIIGYGYSFVGAGVQAEALASHKLLEDWYAHYVFIKDRAASSIVDVGSAMTFKPLGIFAKLFGWDFETAKSSKNLKKPEVILQTASVGQCERLHDSRKIIFDRIIPPGATLAKVLLDDPSCPKQNKTFFGISEEHDNPLELDNSFGTVIEGLLKSAAREQTV